MSRKWSFYCSSIVRPDCLFLPRYLALIGESHLCLAFLDRSVESSRLKRSVEAVYSGILPKGTFPFVYLRYVVSQIICAIPADILASLV